MIIRESAGTTPAFMILKDSARIFATDSSTIDEPWILEIDFGFRFYDVKLVVIEKPETMV